MQLVTKATVLTFLRTVQTAIQTREQLPEVIDVIGDMYMMDAKSNLAGDTVVFMLCNIGNVTKEQLQDIHAVIAQVRGTQPDTIALLHLDYLSAAIAVFEALASVQVLEACIAVITGEMHCLLSEEFTYTEADSTYKI